MKVIAIAEFKAHCLRLVEEVRTRRQPVLVTKRGKPVARLVPVDDPPAPSVFGSMRGTAEILGDIVEPAASIEEWDALK